MTIKNTKGFTIVELLIVIVVIGVLATIAIVAYNGIQTRARAAAVSSDLSNSSKKLSLYLIDNPTYPSDLAALTAAGITPSPGTSFQYTVNNTVSPPTYCITATNGSTSYKTTEATQPTAGGCAGHGTGGVAAITNLMTNPSFETNTSSWATSLTTLTRVTSGGAQGPAYLQAARNAAGDAYIASTLSSSPPLSTKYTLSFWIWADSPVTLSSSILFRHQAGAGSHNLATNSPSITTTPTRIVMSGETNSSSSTGGLQIIGRLPTTVGVPVYYDGFMITQGDTTYTYGDGNTTNWVWNGTINNSTSTGPAS